MSDKIYVAIDNKRIELKGADLEAFLEQQAKDRADYEAEQNLIEAETAKKQADRESAMAKLSALGLNEDEVNAIIGG